MDEKTRTDFLKAIREALSREDRELASVEVKVIHCGIIGDGQVINMASMTTLEWPYKPMSWPAKAP